MLLNYYYAFLFTFKSYMSDWSTEYSKLSIHFQTSDWRKWTINQTWWSILPVSVLSWKILSVTVLTLVFLFPSSRMWAESLIGFSQQVTEHFKKLYMSVFWPCYSRMDKLYPESVLPIVSCGTVPRAWGKWPWIKPKIYSGTCCNFSWF